MAPGPQSEVKAKKKSAFSCEPCRHRKVKCGGEHPTCGRCAGRGDTCVYKLSPTLSYTQKLESRVVELETALRKSQQQQQQPISGPSPGATISSPHSSTADGSASVLGSSFRGLAFDAKGAVTYQGATSLFQLPSRPDDTNVLPPIHEAALGKERLVQNAWEQRALEVLAETPEPFQYLLNNHWCWIQPLFNFVYRPAFTRDMQRMGPYYSHTLLNAMLGHSVRWCRREPEIRHLLEPYDGGELFKRHARTKLFDEIITGNCSIPTIQTLLLLSAQECSAGNRTQAWVYCGMAFRLLEDQGITVDVQRFSGTVHMTDEDIEIRRRLFWTCYFWDKVISLYLGRSPSLQHTPVSPPQIIMDDSAEEELWAPHGLKYSEGSEYPPTKAYSISCFTQMCRLSAIFNEILVHIYDPVQQKSEQEIENCLIREGFAMRQWWQDLPSFLRIDAQALPQYCPPSHIVTLNCLFHTFKILLYRPALFKRPDPLNDRSNPDPTHFKECLSSASAILAIFDLFCRTFGYSRVVLSLAYSVYTAASIFLLQIQASSSREEYTLQSMRFCVQALDRVKESSPVIGDALILILKALADAGIDAQAMLEVQHSSLRSPYSPTTTMFGTDGVGATSTSVGNSGGGAGGANGGAQGRPVNRHSTSYLLPQPPAAFNPDGINFTPEMFETFSSLEPISAAVGIPGTT